MWILLVASARPASTTMAPLGASTGSARKAEKVSPLLVVSLIVLSLVTVMCVVGPFVTPHTYSQIFESYVRTPPSLQPYPLTDTLHTVMRGAADHARVTLTDFAVAGNGFRPKRFASYAVQSGAGISTTRA